MISHQEIQSYKAFSEETLRKAGDKLMSFRNSYQIKKTKDAMELDIATSADYAAESIIVNAIHAAYPGHGILTEETSGYAASSDFEWIIDPLDGTKEFVRHSPYFYTLLALEYKGKLICGAGYQPVIPRMFVAGMNEGVTVDGRHASLSKETELSRAFVSVALPVKEMPEDKCAKYMSFLQELRSKSYRIRNNTWDVEALYNVATGTIEAYVSPSITGPKWWDIASGLVAVESANGFVTDFYGEPIVNRDISRGILACNNKSVQSALLNLLKQLYLA